MTANNEEGLGAAELKDTNKSNKLSSWYPMKFMTKNKNSKKRSSMMSRIDRQSGSHEKKRKSTGSGVLADGGDPNNPGVVGDDVNANSDANTVEPRRLFFNDPLPADLVDDDSHPIQHFTRNKIRTAKYTPLSFVPKNLWFQFHNIANIFFLFVVILVIFPIFGGVNPGLGAVPLIFIIVVTAIKDAIEDYRRTVLDIELNNAPVHRLCQWNNVNVKEDDVSLWRRIKKATTRFFSFTWRAIKSIWKKELRASDSDSDLDEPGHARHSIETRATLRESIVSPRSARTSFMSAREEIQMTPVASPLVPLHVNNLQVPEPGKPAQGQKPPVPPEVNLAHVKGDLIDRDIPHGRAKFHKDAWKNLQVGDFVRIYSDDELPADVIVLSTSDPEGNCFVETKNLDGETNLKIRTALKCGRSLRHARDCERAKFHIECEEPQPNLYKFNGAMSWKQRIYPGDEHLYDMSEPISIDNLLLRGCNVRNTDWVLGVVVYTGHDTKIMMNSGITPSKRARIAREMNWNVIYNFGILTVMCLVSAIVSGAAWASTSNSLTFFDYGSIGGTPGLSGFITFWAAVILFQNLVPISLYISLEIVRTLQAIFIYSDVEMYYEPIDQPCIPKSWNISDDMGQIEYIFSDKTGTLTQNLMEFKKATVNGQPYGEAYTEAQAGMQKRLGIDVEKEGAKARAEIADARIRALARLRRLHDNPYLHDEEVTFIAPDFATDMGGDDGDMVQQEATRRFMLALALCHTVIAEHVPGEVPKILYKAQSPDEAALVSTARDMGFTVTSSTSESITINIMGEDHHYEVLNTIEFTSSRKRMSAIIRMPKPDGRIILFCKGADSVIYSRLKKGEQADLRKTTAEHLEMFAREGLRTLCVAQRVLTESEYDQWRRDYDKAATSLTDREEKMEQVADVIEQDLTLIGGTAIEDCLQDGVPDTIALLGEAGIKLWVLTGDKVETAINIGFSCNLLNNDMELIHIKVEEDETGATSEDDFMKHVEDQLDKYLHHFNLTGSDEDLRAAKKNHEAPGPTHALVIDGFTLKWVLHDELKQKFLLLCKQCKSVLCCRVSPAQKAAVVAMVKGGLDVMTLSIGDGANDVAMIQEADVGVGIAGVEGRQAVMSADYAIGQFRFLQRLVLVHGRWSYRRLAETISNFFYKNIVWTLSIFWYQIYCDFDMTYIFEYTYIIMFNVFFTSVPVILMGVLDQDVSDRVSLAVPQLYRRGIERLEWTNTKFWLHMIDGAYQSVMSFYIPYFTFIGTAFITYNGLDVADRVRLGCYIVHPAVITINMYILINTYRWDWLMILIVIVSDLFIFFWTAIYSSTTYSGVFYQAAAQIYAEPTFWAVLVITPVVCIFPRFAINAMQKVYRPYDVDIIREQVQQGKFDRLEPKGDDSMTADDSNGVLEGQSSNSSDSSRKGKHKQYASVDEDRRPIYPPSVATHNTRTQNGSDGTNYTGHPSLELPPVVRPSMDRTRPSYDRIRASMDRVRPSYEASAEFTSAARLSRIESTHTNAPRRFSRLRGLSLHSGANPNHQNSQS